MYFRLPQPVQRAVGDGIEAGDHDEIGHAVFPAKLRGRFHARAVIERARIPEQELFARHGKAQHHIVRLKYAGVVILLEYMPDVYELLDLRVGKCRMAVAAPADFRDDRRRTLRVATKFMNIAAGYYAALGRDIDMIHLNGSVEIAPILGLSDVIVDIVETGRTLKENHLEVKETVMPISARFIANKASYEFKREKIDALCAGLARLTEVAEK